MHIPKALFNTIQKLMFQDHGYGAASDIRHQRSLLQNACDGTSTHLK